MLAGTAVVGALPVERSAHAAGSDVIRVGLIGCGGRGADAALNALNAGPDVRLVTMADVFADRLESSRTRLKAAKPNQVAVNDDRCFVGFDGYERLIKSDVQVVLIAAASHFHAEMLRLAVACDKHVFCEKPHALDIPGLAVAHAACEEARAKKLSIVSGLCWRYDRGVRETMERVLAGAIGEILAIQETYVGQPYIVRERQPGWTEMEYQMRNWYHFNWLSGDQTAQQLIHSLDKSSWALGDRPPVKAWGLGGRQTCVAPKYGDQFDHQAVVFEYANGVRVYGLTRDQPECYNETSDHFFGTKGRCNLLACRITGETNWRYEGPKGNMYDLEHQALFDAIRSGKPINNGVYMCLSTALAIVAQMACYSGELIVWDEAMRSKRSFALPRYGWDVEPPVKPNRQGRYPAARQGKAELEKWLS
jgi:predicted dehydrogenase